MGPRRSARRFLATLLFTDIVGSTDLAARTGDREWRRLVEEHNAAVRRELRAYRGHEMDTAGDGFFAVFDTPENAVRCAAGIGTAVEPLGLQVRAGVHTGECELIGGKAGGMAVNIAARIAAQAGPAEVLVSSSTRDMTVGSGLRFEGGAERQLKGVTDPWRVYGLVTPVDADGRLGKRPGRRYRPRTGRHVVLGAAALTGGGALVAGALVALHSTGDSGVVLAANAVGRLGDAGASAGDAVDVGQRPTAVASGGGAVWVTNSISNTVSRIDRRTNTVTPVP